MTESMFWTIICLSLFLAVSVGIIADFHNLGQVNFFRTVRRYFDLREPGFSSPNRLVKPKVVQTRK